MAQYTTGQVAKLCGVSVRTVQYYDTREILMPSALSEGGRRLYSQEDLEKMKIICYLRSLELPIDSIKGLFSQPNSGEVITLLLQQQESLLRREIEEKQSRVEKLNQLQKALQKLPLISTGSIGDAAYILKNKKRLTRLHLFMLAAGFFVEAVELVTLMIGILQGIWWPFLVGECIAIAVCILISTVYFTRTAYICPQCHSIFKPQLRESFFANHTPSTRKLTCPQCHYKGFCVEVYFQEDELC